MLTLKRHSVHANDKKHDVVDGQQRLTTLTLVLAAVQQYVKDPEHKGRGLRRGVGVPRGC